MAERHALLFCTFRKSGLLVPSIGLVFTVERDYAVVAVWKHIETDHVAAVVGAKVVGLEI